MAVQSAAVFPQPSHLAELASLSTIRLAETPFPLLLVAHHAAESTGLLVARRGPIEKRVVLDRGVPVDCRSNLAHETFSRFLAATGRLTEGEANAVLAQSLARGVLLGEILVAEGRMDATELHRLLQQSLARKLFDLFTWRDGEVTFESGTFTSAAALKVKVERLVLTGVERFVPQETIDSSIAPLAGSLFALHPDAAQRAGQLRPSESERKLLAALAQPRRLEELLPISALPLAELSRAIWGLALLGLVIPAVPPVGLTARFTADTAETPATPEAPETPEEAAVTSAASEASAPPATSPTAIASIAALAAEDPALGALPAEGPASGLGTEESVRIRQEVATAFARLRHQDPYDLLATSESAAGEEIRENFFRFARQFAPWRFESPELRSAAPAAEELFAAGALAFARLSDAKERAALLSARRSARQPAGEEAGKETVLSLPPVVASAPATPPPLAAPGATQRKAGPTPASFRIDTDLLDPEVQYKKGRALKEGKRWSQALQQFAFAADCDPQNGAYRAEAAHCRFLLAPTSMAVQALEELREAQRIDPEAITPYLYAGEIATELGRFEEAETYLRSAARRLGPTDRRALDALRNLAKRRKK
jgi:tetratricopeptide (TPR) repeat protein